MFRRKIAYDQIITRFSPDGRLFQVEYAFEAVKRGATVIGLACSEGVVLGAEEPIRDALEDSRQSWKIYKLDEHIGTGISGLGPDARVIIDQARIYAQNNRLMYAEPIDVEVLTKRLGNITQLYTQQIWVRPFGISLIIGGIDKTGSKVFKTHPSGSYLSYKATAEGIGRETAESILEEEYRSDMTLNDAIKLTVRCLLKDLNTRNEEAMIRIALIPAETRRFTLLAKLQMDKYKKAIEKNAEKQ